VSYLLDTNIISELHKGERCNPAVAEWYRSIGDQDAYTSVLVVGEISKGIEQIRKRDAPRANALKHWLNSVVTAFAERILLVDLQIAETWGQIRAVRSLPEIDALLAATAKVHGLTLVTRNTDDVAGLGADVLNPFSSR